MLRLTDLHRSFGDVVALDGVSFDVARGRIVGFVGRNGSGKTTTMRIAMGVLDADAGEVVWKGRSVDHEVRRRFGYMPEERGLYPKMRVLEQLVYLARLRGVPRDVARARASEFLERLQVDGSERDRVESLSLGNQQRVQLASSLVHEPELLILDEPFSGLDPVGVDVLSGVLLAQARELGVPVVFSSHQLELVERLCDEVVLIDHGHVAAADTVDGLRASRERNLYRVTVPGAPAGWWEALEGIAPVAQTDGEVVFELSPGVDPQRLLDLARATGDVREFGSVRPTLGELFREVVAE